MITSEDIIDALIKCSGYDTAHTPKPSEIVVIAWAEHFEDFPGVTRDDLLEAVKEYHRTPRDVQLQPAHISLIARKYSRERYERSELDSPERRRLEQLSDAKAAPEAAIEGASSPAAGSLPAGGIGVEGGGAESDTGQISRPDIKTQIEQFAKALGKPPKEIEDRYTTALAKERRSAAPPTALACPDCGSLERCEHDDKELAQ